MSVFLRHNVASTRSVNAFRSQVRNPLFAAGATLPDYRSCLAFSHSPITQITRDYIGIDTIDIHGAARIDLMRRAFAMRSNTDLTTASKKVKLLFFLLPFSFFFLFF